MYTTIDEYYEPINNLSNKELDKSEMTVDQMGFLCGIIRKYMPQKIVEVGVAAGSTTSVILKCVEMIGIKSEIFSIDLNEKLYYQTEKETGYIAKEFYKEIDAENIHFNLMLGKYLPEQIFKIGQDIDFLILDTVHKLPGELLDFLVALPFLSKHAVVVLHDISLEHINPMNDRETFATQILFQTVSGYKFINNEVEYPNIAAFEINDSTKDNISDVFSALTMSWSYFLLKNELIIYKAFFEKYYEKKICRLFDQAITLNTKSISKLNSVSNRYFASITESLLPSFEHLLIYGAGFRGNGLFNILNKYNNLSNKLEYVVSYKNEAIEKDCCSWGELNYKREETLIILAVKSEEVKQKLHDSDWIWIDIPEFIWNDIESKYLSQIYKS